MTHFEKIIRLLAATMSVLISATFVFIVSSVQTGNVRCLGIANALPSPAQFYASYSPLGFVVSFFILVAGLLYLRRENTSHHTVTLICHLGWLFALAWALGCILAWQLPYLMHCPEIK